MNAAQLDSAEVLIATTSGRLYVSEVVVGAVVGLLTIESLDAKRKVALCVCDCGKKKEVLFHNLRHGFVRSCGCLRERSKIKHGCAFTDKKTKEYRAWHGIKDRTCNPNNKGYPGYGGRGITMFPEWQKSFSSFFAHIGPAPTPQHSVDRIDTYKGYEPGNVRWATKTEQGRNSRSNVLNMDLARKIRAARKDGMKPRHIAQMLTVSVSNVYCVLKGHCWREETETKSLP